MADYSKITYAIVNNVYPLVEESLNKNKRRFMDAISDFFNYNHDIIFNTAPYNIIYHRQSDIDKLFKSLQITENEIKNIMKDCFYWKLPYNPTCAKEPYVVVVMMVIRYFIINKDAKNAELAATYLAFSGKFYASLFSYDAFPVAAPNPTVMDYVVNNMLTNKHLLRTEKNMFGAIKYTCNTWMDTYHDIFVSRLDDDEVGKLIQQLRDREKAFLMNVVKLYYEANENKQYLNYETDNRSQEEFRITDNDSLKAARYTDNTINYMTNNSVSLQICNSCKSDLVKATEVKDIMEAIISNKENLTQLRRVINILICDFIRYYPDKSIGGIDFISHSVKLKPNTKDPYIIELKDTIISWLDDNSPNYRRRKNRKPTAIAYYKAVLMYIVLAISYASK